MYARFIVLLDGEYQGVGFLQGLDDTALPECEKNRLVGGFDGLAIPQDVFRMGPTESWFSEAGEERFGDAIDDVVRAYEEDGLFEVERIEAPSVPGDVVYEDTWQAIALPRDWNAPF